MIPKIKMTQAALDALPGTSSIKWIIGTSLAGWIVTVWRPPEHNKKVELVSPWKGHVQFVLTLPWAFSIYASGTSPRGISCTLAAVPVASIGRLKFSFRYQCSITSMTAAIIINMVISPSPPMHIQNISRHRLSDIIYLPPSSYITLH